MPAAGTLQTQRLAPLVLPVPFLVHGFRGDYGRLPWPPARLRRAGVDADQTIRSWIVPAAPGRLRPLAMI